MLKCPPVFNFAVRSYIAQPSGSLAVVPHVTEHQQEKHVDRKLFLTASKFIRPIAREHIAKLVMSTDLHLQMSSRGASAYLDQMVTLPFTVGSQGKKHSVDRSLIS